MSPGKAMSVRLPGPMHEQLSALVRIEGVHVSELVREAIEEFMSRRITEKDFKDRLNQRLKEDWEILKLLGRED